MASEHGAKIGISNEPEKRLGQVQTGHPARVKLSKVFWFFNREEPALVEQAVHRQLKRKGVHTWGEWFKVRGNEAEIVISEIIRELAQEGKIESRFRDVRNSSSQIDMMIAACVSKKWRASQRGNEWLKFGDKHITVFRKQAGWCYVYDDWFATESFDSIRAAKVTALQEHLGKVGSNAFSVDILKADAQTGLRPEQNVLMHTPRVERSKPGEEFPLQSGVEPAARAEVAKVEQVKAHDAANPPELGEKRTQRFDAPPEEGSVADRAQAAFAGRETERSEREDDQRNWRQTSEVNNQQTVFAKQPNASGNLTPDKIATVCESDILRKARFDPSEPEPESKPKRLASLSDDEFDKLLCAARLGNTDAQYHLGCLHEGGVGVVTDSGQAVQWYWRAAENGNTSAQYRLGMMYEVGGSHVGQNFLCAHMWFQLASTSLDETIRKHSSAANYRIAAKLTADEISESLEMASSLKTNSND
jgi:hypothetical protein